MRTPSEMRGKSREVVQVRPAPPGRWPINRKRVLSAEMLPQERWSRPTLISLAWGACRLG